MSDKKKLIRVTTVPLSLEKLLENQLPFMSNYYDVIAVSSDKDRLETFGKKAGIRTFHIELTRKITPFKDLIALWKMYRFLKKEKPWIVHTHTPKAGTIGMLAAKFAKVPNRLHTVAGLPLLEITGLKRKLLNFIEKATYWAATNIYPNSFGLKDIIIEEKFCKSSKLKVIGNGSSNGINTSYFDKSRFDVNFLIKEREKYTLQPNDFVFVFVGRVVSNKGINELISAFDKLNIRFKSIKLLLVGPRESYLDPLKENTDQIINKNKNIIEVGYQDDIRPFLAMSDVLVFPSYREGFPNVVMQAGLMELPSIVSDINGCNEIIEQKINGIIIPVKNEIAIFEAMEYVFKNTELRNEMIQKARQLIIDKYDQNYIWGEILKEYQSLT